MKIKNRELLPQLSVHYMFQPGDLSKSSPPNSDLNISDLRFVDFFNSNACLLAAETIRATVLTFV